VRSSPRARAAFLLLYGALLAWQIDRWFFTSHGLVSTWDKRHDAVVASAGSPDGISQSFTMGADGLEGVWLRPLTNGRPAVGDLIVDLSQVQGLARVRLERVAVPAADIVSGGNLYVPFRQIRSSRGQAYELNIRHVHASNGPALEFLVAREDGLAAGRLFADGVEQWGDLVFEINAGRSTLPYWLHEVLRPWPAWVRSGVVIGLVLLLFNLLLVWSCAAATGALVGSRRAVAGASAARSEMNQSDADRPSREGLVRLTRLAATVIALGGIVTCVLPAPSVREVDLLRHVPDARFETVWPLHAGIALEPAIFFQRVYRGLVMMPPATVTWTIDVPPDAVFTTRAGGRADLWLAQSDGFSMFVEVIDAGRVTPIARLGLFPLGVPAHRNLHPVAVSLAPWRGRRVNLRLRVDPGDAANAVNDVPVWVEPRITCGRRPCDAVVRGATD
jgi:hypothetical protein